MKSVEKAIFGAVHRLLSGNKHMKLRKYHFTFPLYEVFLQIILFFGGNIVFWWKEDWKGNIRKDWMPFVVRIEVNNKVFRLSLGTEYPGTTDWDKKGLFHALEEATGIHHWHWYALWKRSDLIRTYFENKALSKEDEKRYNKYLAYNLQNILKLKNVLPKIDPFDFGMFGYETIFPHFPFASQTKPIVKKDKHLTFAS